MPVLIILATILATASVSSFLAISQGVFFAVSAVVYYLTTVAKAIEAK
jgi:cation transport ATPase